MHADTCLILDHRVVFCVWHNAQRLKCFNRYMTALMPQLTMQTMKSDGMKKSGADMLIYAFGLIQKPVESVCMRCGALLHATRHIQSQINDLFKRGKLLFNQATATAVVAITFRQQLQMRLMFV